MVLKNGGFHLHMTRMILAMDEAKLKLSPSVAALGCQIYCEV